MRPLILYSTLFLLFAASASAGSSLKLGATLPGWDEVRGGNLQRTASAVALDYAGQVRHYCTAPEVFIQAAAGSLAAARVSYDDALPAGTSQRVLHDADDQRVTLVTMLSARSAVLSVLVVTASGVVLILC